MIGFKIANKTLDLDDIDEKIFIKNELKEYNKCQARIWDGGKGTQCGHIIASGSNCLCKVHYNACTLRMPNNKWWLGLVNEDRPEYPINPTTGIVHQWIYDINGTKILDEKKEEIKEETTEEVIKVKKPRGRPKGSKNKKKINQ